MDQNAVDTSLIDGSYDPNGYGLDPMSGDTIANDPTLAEYGEDANGNTIANIPQAVPDYFPDPGAASGGSVTASNGGTAISGGGSGFGTFLSGLGTFFGGALKGAGIVNGSPVGTPTGRTATGAPCVLGTLGCGAAASVASNQTTMMVLIAVGAIVLVVALRGKS